MTGPGAGLHVRLRGGPGVLRLDMELEAPAGRITALVGASGAGKSTVLRAVAGLVRLEGEVRLGSETWQDGTRFIPAHRRRAGLVFQHGALLPHLSVAGNLAYAERRAVGEPTVPRAEIAALLGLEPLLPRSPATLSGGERRRVAVARALASRPRLLLLDEPLTGLDLAARDALMPQLKAVLTMLAIPIVYVSHDRGEVAQMCDRVLTLSGGRLVEDQGADALPELQGRSAEEIARLAAAAVRAGLDGR